MRRKRARCMLEIAIAHVGNDLREPYEFEKVRSRQFLRVYLWILYSSGFSNAVVKKHFPALKDALHNLDLDAIADMRSINADRFPIRNQRKADWFLAGCKLIGKEGWRAFKKRLKTNHRDVLREFPDIGCATWQHMA